MTAPGEEGKTPAMPQARRTTNTARANRAVMVACLAFVLSMVGMAYAAVPIYQLFCQVTGYGGTTQRAEAAPQSILDKKVNVRFDANVGEGLPWDFEPVQREVTVRLGETMQVAYRVTNRSSEPVHAQALFNVTPQSAGAYFNKVECFCFTETVLKPGETAELPIVFFIDPAYVKSKELKNIHTLTLSYTYFPIAGSEAVGSAEEPAKADKRKT
jgi:cytochrome c oxidase assembly protein subunit 11